MFHFVEFTLSFSGCADPPRYSNTIWTPLTGPYPIGSIVNYTCTYQPNCTQGDNCYQCLYNNGTGLSLRCTEHRQWKQVRPFLNQDPPLPPVLPSDPYCDSCRRGQSEYCGWPQGLRLWVILSMGFHQTLKTKCWSWLVKLGQMGLKNESQLVMRLVTWGS